MLNVGEDIKFMFRLKSTYQFIFFGTFNQTKKRKGIRFLIRRRKDNADF